MTRRDLSPLMAGLLDALGYAGTPVLVVADRGSGLERWYLNKPTAAMFGYTVEEALALPPHELFAPEQRTFVQQMSAGFREGQPVPPSLELVGLHRDGRRVAIECALGTHRTSDGCIVYVTILRALGGQEPSHMSLLEADRIGLVGALAAGFAHETNNPLTSVLLNLRSLRKQLHQHMPDSAQAPAVRCLDDITTGAERIASNVRALQTLATRSETKPIDLAAVVSAALRLVAPSIEPRAHIIRQIFPVRPVAGEEARVGQAVIAMMLFSASGFPEDVGGNRIIVAVEERGDDVVIEVSDNGRDLTPEEARRAFDPFFRSPARGAGVGVGLGVARSVAATLGGAVALAPRPGGGVVITMRLPAAA
jgi:PAS domain S-box-containing protein